MKESKPIKTYSNKKMLELLEVVVDHSMVGPTFRKSGMALLENQLQQTNEMRLHRMRHTSNRDLEEWINIMSRTIDSLEKELIQREEQALQDRGRQGRPMARVPLLRLSAKPLGDRPSGHHLLRRPERCIQLPDQQVRPVRVSPEVRSSPVESFEDILGCDGNPLHR